MTLKLQQKEQCEYIYTLIGTNRGGSTLGQGARAPRFTCCPSPPDSKASWPFWRDFWGPKMLQNANFPDPAGGAYSAPPDSVADKEGARCSPPKNPTPALRPLGLVSTGLMV